ncbi:MAG: AmmeMemoRadiSam system protein B [Novosphingobium sp.]|nr:AmmeMemoRadiSam system protein B [Novosphingobium sp.]
MKAPAMIREPAVAGTFYPDSPDALRATVARMLAVEEGRTGAIPIKALIVPHAGYVYSGEAAGRAYARLSDQAETIERVVLLGPVHRVPVRGLALPDADSFSTPLGDIPIDRELVDRLRSLPQVVTSGQAHAREHSLEVQLPFLQSVLGRFSLAPLAVGSASAQDVAEVLETVWGGPETLIVISSDLSHYLPYDQACKRDSDTVGRIMQGIPLGSHEQACGATPINGLLEAARRHHLSPELVSLCNSGDTAGDRSRVVGYAAIAFSEGADSCRPRKEDEAIDQRGPVLLALARAAIASKLGFKPDKPIEAGMPWLHQAGATFVTLTLDGNLRGCIGSLVPSRSLLDDILANARAAAFSDNRFAPLSRDELDKVRVEVSLLSPLQPMPFNSEADVVSKLQPGIDGVVLEYGRHRGTFLPQVWESLPEPREFLDQLKRKAGLPADFWSDDIVLKRYHVTKFKEPESGRRAQ